MNIPLHEGPENRQRVGPFWIEEGVAPLVVEAVVIAIVAILYIIATLSIQL